MTNARAHQPPYAAQLLSFVAAQGSLAGELEAAVNYASDNRVGVIVAAANAADTVAALTRTHPSVSLTVDTVTWRRNWATTETPSLFHPDERTGAMFGLNRRDWADEVRRRARTDRLYHPGYTVPAGHRDVLDAAIVDTLASGQLGLDPVLALDAAALSTRHLETTREVFSRYSGQKLILRLNATRALGLAKFDRIEGLRQVLQLMPGLDLTGVDIITALDALAHGAGHVAIGASSSHRFPRNPDGVGSGSGNANGYKPGTWNRELMATHSPDHYADWYVQAPSPICTPCDRPLDVFDATPSDKSAAIAHNLHGSHDHIAELLAQPAEQRVTWLAFERLAAFQRHQALVSSATRVSADPMLRALVSVDDPQQRSTTPDGHWQTV